MPRVLLAVASIALTVYALASCIQTESSRVRGIPQWAWILLIVLVPWAGPITWLLIGREPAGTFPRRDGRHPTRRPGPIAPDDDPEFLRRLDEQIREEARERERRARDDRDTDGTAP